MNKEFVNLKDQQVLYEIKDYLEKIQIASTLLEASEEIPFNILVAITGEQASVNIMYVPIPEDHFEDIRLIQLYSLIVPIITSDKRNDLLILLNDMNNRCAVGTFFINEQSELGFKYIFPTNRFEIPKENNFIETFTLFINSMLSLIDLIIQVNNGSLAIDDALKQLNAD